jgi:TP901 family phage tail tape measure protein
MADVNANIGVNIDTSNALAQLKSLQRQISQFHTSIARSSETAAVAQKSLQKNLLGSINSIGAFSAELRTVKTSAESFTNSLEKNKFSMREYFRYAGASTKTFGKVFKSEFDTIGKVAEERVKTLQTQYIKLGRNASGAMEAIAIRPTSLNMEDYGTKTQIAAQKQALFNQLMKQGSTNLLNFGKNTQWAGRQLMVGFTIPLAMVGSAATKTFMEMEAQAIKFKKVYGDLFTPKEETQQALDNITELGRSFTKYGVAVSTTVGLAAEAAAAGFSGLDLQRQTTEATRLSILGQIDTQKALETTISLQNAFGMSSDNLADSINFLNAVENQTVVSLDDITTAIPKVAPVVQQLGGDIKDLTFFITAMKEGGINASEGANALKSGLAALINPTGRASEMLKGFGINASEIVTKNKGNLKATVIEFAEALNQLDPLNRAQAIEQMFGKFQFARLSALFANVTKEGNQASRVLDLANSSVEELSALSEQELGMTAESSMNKFKKSVEDLKFALVPVGQAFLEAVTPIVEFVAQILEKFTNLSDGTKKALTVMAVVIGAIGPIALMTFGLLANGVANIIKLFLTLRNGYQRLTGQSQILGEQTNYLTMEQMEAAAVASSLDQRHARLAQTFNVETAELTRLIAAYQSATSAGQKFAAINPGAMMPPRRKGFAAGGIIRGPGSGTADLIPIMASNGEAIIPAKNVNKYPELTAGLVAGNIPGFKKGTVGVGIERAHATGSFSQSSAQFQSALDMVAGLRELNRQFPGMIRVVSNLTAELPTKLNQAIKEVTLKDGKVSGGVGVDRFQSEYGMLQGKFDASAARGGANIQDPRVQSSLLNFENMVGERAVQIANGTEDLKVTDTIFAKATREVIDEFNLMEGNAKEVGMALDKVSKEVGQIRIQPSQDQYRKGLASGAFSIDPTGKVARFGDIDVARPKRATKAGLAAARPASNINLPGNYTGGRDLARLAGQVTDEAVLATARAAGTKSPSKKTIPIGEDIARGLEVGMANRKDDVAKAGANLGTSATQATSRGTRRATRPQGAPLSAVAAQMPISPDIKAATVEQARVIKNTSQRMQSLDRGLMGASFAISSLTGLASMSGGALGNMAGTISKVTGAMFALQAVTSLLTQTNLLSLASKKAELVGFVGANKVTGLFSGGIKKLLPNLLRFGGMIARFLGPVGLAITAFTGTVSIIRLVNKARERERLAVEGLADAMVTTTSQVKTLGEFFGVVPTKLPFEQGQREFVAPEVRSQRETLKADAGFQKEFKTQIESLRKATNDEAKIAFSSLALNLKAQGFASDQVQVIVDALREESSQTDVILDVKSLTLSQESLDQIKKDVAPLLVNLNKALKTGMTTKSVGGRYGAPITEIIELNKDAQKQLETTSTFISETAKSASGMFEVGLIDGKTYEATLNTVLQTTIGLDDAQRKLLLSKVFEKLGADASALNGVLGNTAREMRFLALMSAGILSKDSKILQGLAGKLGEKGERNAAIQLNRLYDKMFGSLQKIGDEQNKVNDYVPPKGDGEDDPYTKAIKDLKAQRLEIGYTSKAFSKLKSIGTETARAYELAKNPILAAALATTKVGTEKWDKLLKLIRAVGREELNNLTTQEVFDKLNTQASEYFGILEAEIQDRFENPIRDAEKAADDAAEAVSKIQEEISVKQNVISSIQRTIEETITRDVGDIQEEIDLLQRKIEESIDRPINALQAESTVLSEALTLIDKAADGINSKYDKQEEALSKISSLNQEIANQQKQQLGLADALSQGDIAAAAAAAQEMRATAAAAQDDRVMSGLSASREAELGALVGPNGMTRDQIASRQYEIDRQTYALEQSRIPIQAEILRKQDSIYKLELLRQPLVKDIRDIEDEIFKIQNGRLLNAETEAKNRATELKDVQNKLKAELDGIEAQKEKWSDTQLAIDLAKIKGGEFNGVIGTTKKLMTDIVNGWNGLSSKDIELRITTVRTEIINTLNKPINSAGGPSTISPGAVQFKAYGGKIKKMANGGFVPGIGMTDKVPALLTPGEFVMNKSASTAYGPMLSQLNESKYPSMNRDSYSNAGQPSVSTSVSNNSSAVYNYSVGINVGGSSNNANDIANAVISQIKYIDAQRIRGQR